MADVAALKAQIAAKLAAVQATLGAKKSTLPPSLAAATAVKQENNADWVPLLLDSEGRQINAEGQIISQNRNSTLKVNQQSAKVKGEAGAGGARTQGSHIDIRLKAPVEERKSRALSFVKPGKYVKKAQTMRMQQLATEMKAQRYEASDTAEKLNVVRKEPIPAVEWWDQVVLSPPGKDEQWSYDSEMNVNRITHYVYHPVPLRPVVEAAKPKPMVLYLTAAEKKKIRYTPMINMICFVLFCLFSCTYLYAW